MELGDEMWNFAVLLIEWSAPSVWNLISLRNKRTATL